MLIRFAIAAAPLFGLRHGRGHSCAFSNAQLGGIRRNYVQSKWELKNRTLSISGIGGVQRMRDFGTLKERAWDRRRITTVKVRNISHVGAYAFSQLHELEVVTLDDSLGSIGRGAFEDCQSLRSVIIPNSVLHIGDGAFRRCGNLSTVVYMGCSEMGGSLFDSCVSLESVRVSGCYSSRTFGGKPVTVLSDEGEAEEPLDVWIAEEGLLGISEGAFRNCSSLTRIVIPSTVVSIADDAFEGCTGICTANFAVLNSKASRK